MIHREGTEELFCPFISASLDRNGISIFKSALNTSSTLLKMVQIVGKYEHESSKGLEEYLKTVGGAENLEASKVFSQGKPTFEISQSGDHWIITISNEGKSSTTKFVLGTPYDETMPHGLVLKVSTVSIYLFFFNF